MNYDASAIRVLKGLEGVRHRPAMYIGGTGVEGYHHLFKEILDNAVDEALAGYATEILVRLNEDGSLTVEDNGRGIPVDLMPEEGKPAVEVIYTTLHSGGKFEQGAYKVSGGLHGVGASVVNALSEWTVVEVFREGKHHRIAFSRGEVTEPLRVVGEAPRGKTGTRVTFKPDPEIFGNLRFDPSKIRARLREVAYLVAGLKLVFQDRQHGREEVFLDKGGVASFAKALAEGEDLLYEKPFLIRGTHGEVEVEVGVEVEVEVEVQRRDPHLRQHDPHPGRGYPPHRLQVRLQPRPEPVRQEGGPQQGKRPPAHGGRPPGGALRRGLGEAPQPPV